MDTNETTISIEPKLREIIGNLIFQVASLQAENEHLKKTIIDLKNDKDEHRKDDSQVLAYGAKRS